MRGTSLHSASTRQLLDVGVPALLTVLAITQLVSDEPPGNAALVTVGALAAVLPLAVRRRFPLPVTVVVAAGVGLQVVAADGAPATFASFVATMICVYTLAREAPPVTIAAGYAVLAVAVTGITVLQARDDPIETFEFVYPLVYFGLSGGLGAFVRQRALRLSAVEDRAAALEGELEREAELAAAQERTRIARELHDVVAHGLSLMVVQAEAAEALLASSPDAAVQPLRRVQDTGREALGEMRRLLGVLRAAGDQASTSPQPSLGRIPELVREAAEVGLTVDVVVTGEPAALPLGLELAAFRIVQEALTNTRRHARATRACVRLDHTPVSLRIEITDDGRGPAGRSTGHGLVGMRERAALYGGTLEAGTDPDGGFRVTAVLPVGVPAP
ncbi:sensor histidine kinase [Blastococcus sp. CT_GayMR19]|uniref:sensor histidine kinase n=1 Tax=Blastococcus sp. CT_GayMR19 TaxID=2559608 RepID=UPI0010735176|nr:sensor histidine kinase [Blastococcus sp. CT_GayMR19]TFV72983.1 sensor histidine kinase [Blastococcus sp. CT_GayMR19]